MFEAANSTHFHFTVEGLEAISSDYAVEVVLVCNHLCFDITQLLSKPAFIMLPKLILADEPFYFYLSQYFGELQWADDGSDTMVVDGIGYVVSDNAEKT